MDEKELIRRSQTGDGEAFGVLVERYKGKVFSLAYGFARDRVAADDLAQEVFIKAYFSLPKFKARSEFGTWLYRIAVNHAKDYLRKNRSRLRDMSIEDVGEQRLAAEDMSQEDIRAEEERRALVLAALGRLPEKYRNIVTLRDVEGMSYEDISRILDLSPGTVDSRLHRARQKLREKLAARLGYEGGDNGL
ncbi:MAG TPA: sigma-70 family RNA polymerase sigma factor [Candidatus Desulfaltia sp.]|nr:sigma-70 family RNA polymerase sigma factor [Candidatus Desulfaltia sp.]